MTNTTLVSLYERTLTNCHFYESEGNKVSLLNEIGVLRGIAYCMEAEGICTHNDEFIRLIELQNSIKEEMLNANC